MKKDNAITTTETLKVIVDALQDKKGSDVVVLDLRGLTALTDFFVIGSGESTPQTKALVENVESKLKMLSVKPLSIEGLSQGNWVLMDYNDVIVHVFLEQSRAFYQLERLWLDAPRGIPQESTHDREADTQIRRTQTMPSLTIQSLTVPPLKESANNV